MGEVLGKTGVFHAAAGIPRIYPLPRPWSDSNETSLDGGTGAGQRLSLQFLERPLPKLKARGLRGLRAVRSAAATVATADPFSSSRSKEIS